MEWSWFKQCLTAWHSFSLDEVKALDVFAERHAYQANARFAQACISPQQGTTDFSWHLPDRSALFHAQQTPHGIKGERGPQTELESIPALSRKITAVLGRTGSPEPRPKRKPLPVYARPLPASIPTLQDNQAPAPAPLIFESSLNSAAKRIPRQSVFPINQTERTPSEESSSPDRRPVMDRFERSLTEGIEHHGSGKDRNDRTSFLQWLHRVSSSSPVKELPASPSHQARHEDGTALLPAVLPGSLEKYREGKKKKKKKKTKQLVKASVRKNENVATETLARLLALQGHGEEAIEMYERLQLLYPEKKATFAAQIELIKSKRKDP